MKKTNKLLALLLVLTLFLGVKTYASFPVKNENKKAQTSEFAKEELKTIQSVAIDEPVTPTDPKLEVKEKSLKEKITALLTKYLKKSNGDWDIFSILGFAFGILGLLTLPILFGIVAIVLSAIGLKKTSNGKKGKGFAIAGLVLGIVEVLLIFLLFGLILAVLA